MILATVNTGRYDWSVVAPAEDVAAVYLLAAYRRHVEALGADPEVMEELIAGGEVEYTELVAGVVWRDGSPFWSAASDGVES